MIKVVTDCSGFGEPVPIRKCTMGSLCVPNFSFEQFPLCLLSARIKSTVLFNLYFNQTPKFSKPSHWGLNLVKIRWQGHYNQKYDSCSSDKWTFYDPNIKIQDFNTKGFSISRNSRFLILEWRLNAFVQGAYLSVSCRFGHRARPNKRPEH